MAGERLILKVRWHSELVAIDRYRFLIVRCNQFLRGIESASKDKSLIVLTICGKDESFVVPFEARHL